MNAIPLENIIIVTGKKSITEYNTLRRDLYKKLKNPAMNAICIRKNTTNYNDETIYHRWSMAPVDYVADDAYIYRYDVGPCDIYSDNTEKVRFSERVLLLKLYSGQELEVIVIPSIQQSETHAMYNNLNIYYDKYHGMISMIIEVYNNFENTWKWINENLKYY